MKKSKVIDLQLKMVSSELDELERHISDLEVDEKKFKYYLILDKLYFISGAVDNRKYESQIDDLISRVEKSYESEVLSDERLKMVDKGVNEVIELREYLNGDDEFSTGVYECRVIHKGQLDILLKYIGKGKVNVSEDEIKKDISDYLLDENVDALENVSILDKLFVKELLSKPIKEDER